MSQLQLHNQKITEFTDNTDRWIFEKQTTITYEYITDTVVPVQIDIFEYKTPQKLEEHYAKLQEHYLYLTENPDQDHFQIRENQTGEKGALVYFLGYKLYFVKNGKLILLNGQNIAGREIPESAVVNIAKLFENKLASNS